jgi:hypothetical protein
VESLLTFVVSAFLSSVKQPVKDKLADNINPPNMPKAKIDLVIADSFISRSLYGW